MSYICKRKTKQMDKFTALQILRNEIFLAETMERTFSANQLTKVMQFLEDEQ